MNQEGSKNHREKMKISLNDKEKAVLRAKNAERMQLSRKKLRENKAAQEKEKTFATPQVRGKLLKRTRDTLKGTESQNKKVLSKLLSEYNNKALSVSLPPNVLPQEISDAVKTFYFNNEISRPSPNQNDFINVKENGVKIQKSVRHLIFPIKEVHGMFLEEHTSFKVSYSKFYHLKPQEIFVSSKMPHNICVCEIHENMRLRLEALQKSVADFHSIFVGHKMHKNFVCDEESETCFSNECENCCDSKKLKEISSNLQNNYQEMAWFKWQKQVVNNDASIIDHVNLYCNVEKVKCSGFLSKLLEEIYDTVPAFLEHQFVKMNQSKSSVEMTEIAEKSDSSSAVVMCDFAENFKCFTQNATQSANYGQTPVTCFTVAVYHRFMTSYVLATDYEKHTKDSVVAFIDYILEKIPKTAKEIHFWSDNATSQFKNQFIMESLKVLQKRWKKRITWNFYAAMHGKSVVDGIGGSVKRFVRRKILTENALIKNATDFVSAASTMKTRVVLMKESAINYRNKAVGLQEIIKSSKKIANIKKNHYFEVIEQKSGQKTCLKIVGSKISPKVSVLP